MLFGDKSPVMGPRWTFTTNWMQGTCSIDDLPCEFQVVINESCAVFDKISRAPDVTEIESAILEWLKLHPVTCEELYGRMTEILCPVEIEYLDLQTKSCLVRCRSERHGVLEFGL